MSSFPDSEASTQSGRKRAPASSEPPLSLDVHEALGEVMASTARTERKVKDMAQEWATISAEVRGLRRDIQVDRDELVASSSRGAAKHASNRMAALLGTLFMLYTEAAPVLHQMFTSLHK